MNPKDESLLDVKNLKVYYGSRSNPLKAVDNISFKVNKREIFGIVGESGSGKSTLANSIIRNIQPPGYIADGEIFFRGIELSKMSEYEMRNIRWKEISILPQSAMNALNPVLRVHEQIKDVFEAHKVGKSHDELEKNIEILLNNVALPFYINKTYPCQLSGGMRQRVILAMALALNPKLLIVDEPTSALDVVTQKKILQLIYAQKEKDCSVIIITHDIAILAEIADMIAVMYAGQIMEIGNVFDVFLDPLNPYTKKLIASVPSLRSEKKIEGIKGSQPNLMNPPPGCRFSPRCSYASDICTQKEPMLQEVKSGRFIACNMYE
jgi:peptide/nickel transport system ATP-binding protein